jgi:hypothetical protein
VIVSSSHHPLGSLFILHYLQTSATPNKSTMSQYSTFASSNRAGKAPLTRLEAKNMIRYIGKGSFTMFARLLDIKPDFYESRIATIIR